MSLTVRTVVDDLLSYLNANQRTIPPDATVDNPLTWALQTIHGALQEMTGLAPALWFKTRRGGRIYAPVTLTIGTVTGGTASFSTSGISGWASWMNGCSILIAGEKWNRIIDVIGSTAYLLNVPLASGSNVSATVYCDSVSIDTDIIQILNKVQLNDRYDLDMAGTYEDLQYALYSSWNDPFGSGMAGTDETRPTSNVIPRLSFVETFYKSSFSEPAKRMLLAPMPIAAGLFNFAARIAPPKFATSDIYGAGPGYADPLTPIPVEDSLAIAIFQPIARKRWMACPWWNNDEAAKEIERQYEVAMALVSEMFPQTGNGLKPRPPAPQRRQPKLV